MNQVDKYKEKIKNEFLEKIFGYAFNKTGQRQKAEELAQEIIVELYTSLDNVDEIQNFQGWVWSIARYTFYHWLDKMSGKTSIEIIGPIKYEEDIEKKVIINEELRCLRREISFLSKKYREIIILYYFDNKSCKEISEILGIPIGTIKWYLHDARQKLKWGIDKVRNMGESSFSPGVLNLGLQGSSGMDNSPITLTQRKIPQNILLKSYKNPVSIEALSEELGIARPYMEEEVKLLIEGDLLRKIDQNRVQSNFIIADLNKIIAISDVLLKNYKLFASKMINYINNEKDNIISIDFYKNGLSWQRLLWVLIPVCVSKSLNEFITKKMNIIPFERLPKRKDGGKWIGIGTEKPKNRQECRRRLINKFGENKAKKIEYIGFNGPWEDNQDNWGKWWLGTFWSGYNTNEYYKKIRQEEVELFNLIAKDKLNLDNLNQEKKEILSNGIEEGYIIKSDNVLKLNFPFFFKNQLEELISILVKVYPIIKEIYMEIYEELINELSKDIPDYLEKEIDNYICAFLYSLTPLTFDYALERDLISQAESNSSYLSFYIWCEE